MLSIYKLLYSDFKELSINADKISHIFAPYVGDNVNNQDSTSAPTSEELITELYDCFYEACQEACASFDMTDCECFFI